MLITPYVFVLYSFSYVLLRLTSTDSGSYSAPKPEGQKAFSIYPDKADLNRFFTTLKQAQDTMDSLRVELAQKYYAMAETKPDLKVDLFGSGQHNEVDMNRIQKVNVFKAKNDVILCAATIDGADKLQPRVVSPSQWQRMWIAEDKNEYKKHLAATLFADILQKGQAQEQTASEKQGDETEVKQETQVSTDKHEEEHREYHAHVPRYMSIPSLSAYVTPLLFHLYLSQLQGFCPFFHLSSEINYIMLIIRIH